MALHTHSPTAFRGPRNNEGSWGKTKGTACIGFHSIHGPHSCLHHGHVGNLQLHMEWVWGQVGDPIHA
jgi:hypothetical protein